MSQLAPEKALRIKLDGRSQLKIAAAYDVSIGTVRYIQDGRHQGAEALLARQAKPLPKRHYRPFRDGTYPE